MKVRSTYRGQAATSVPVTLAIDREAALYLQRKAPGRTAGRFVSRLLYEARLREKLDEEHR